ncbi:MAG: gliding motility-associated C-terminal domain-containing protein, partial [Bacteroidota bacterium]|nr:gliding motility-associated C-terminal domain-containing protein [Bacteroidota bacterium]
GTADEDFSDTLAVDNSPPSVRDLDSISVDEDGNVLIGWTEDKTKDVKAYIVYLNTVGQTNFPVDTLFGQFNNFYSDTATGDPEAAVQRYRLAVMDSCENASPLGNIHYTMFLSLTQDTCKQEIYLSWTPYRSWSDGVQRYEVFYSDDVNKQLRIAGAVSGATLQYTFQNAQAGRTYRFFVRAYMNRLPDVTSSSNRVNMVSGLGIKFEYTYIRAVRPSGNGGLSIVWQISPQIPGKIEVLRGDNPKSISILVSGLNFGNGLDSFVDVSAREDRIYYYRINVYDKCGNLVSTSQNASNITLTAEGAEGGNKLTWQANTGWSGHTEHYEVYRTDNLGGWEFIGQADGNVTSFTDLDSIAEHGPGGVCYMVVAFEGNTNEFGFRDITWSNKVCFVLPPVVYVPNAMVKDGVTLSFAPSLRFVDTTTATLRIYSRQGAEIFSTTNVRKGWDGKDSNGNYYPEGVYLFILDVRGYDKTRQVVQGFMHLL